MTHALNDYNNKLVDNTWGAHSNEQRQIGALTAELKTINNNNIELSRSILSKLKEKRERSTRDET